MTINNNFSGLINRIQDIHDTTQLQAFAAVNKALTIRNWLIGFYIVEYEQDGEDRAVYGIRLLSNLAHKLENIKGLDERSLRTFRQFYQYYHYLGDIIWGSLTPKFQNHSIRGSVTPELNMPNFNQHDENVEIPSPHFDNRLQLPPHIVINKLSYTHLEALLKISDHLKRTFYELECIKGNWSVRELKRQINSLYYERSGMSLKPELLSEITQQKAEKLTPASMIKSIYAFEFLGLKAQDAIEENDLESALLDHIQDFILEMGNGFCFEARQKKILIGDEYFYVDLVFYHRILKCHILVELKVEDFKHHNIGQLNTYVNYYKAEVKQPDDQPPVGILLVTDKNNALVEYATAGMDNHLFVSKYLLELPKKEVLEAFILNEIKKWT